MSLRSILSVSPSPLSDPSSPTSSSSPQGTRSEAGSRAAGSRLRWIEVVEVLDLQLLVSRSLAFRSFVLGALD